tara:strand:+ start:5623 stop:5988 length:366 start_codon:yes stop_codon:yes gene_type:complete
VYQSAVETSRVFLRDTTVVQLEALLLFGGEISVDHASSTVSVSLGGGLRDDEKTKKKEKKTFPSSAEVGVLFKLLRLELNRVLAVCAENPAAKEACLEHTTQGRRVRDVLLRLFPGGSVKE